MGKSGVLEHKSGNISETRKDRGKVTMAGLYRNLLPLFRTVPSPTPYGLPFTKIGVRTPPKTSIAIISGTGKSTNFKFGQYIHRVHPNKSPLKFREKGAWAYPGTAQSFKVPPIISGTGKATNFKFCTHIHRIDGNKSPLKISGKLAVGLLRDSRKFSGHP